MPPIEVIRFTPELLESYSAGIDKVVGQIAECQREKPLEEYSRVANTLAAVASSFDLPDLVCLLAITLDRLAMSQLAMLEAEK